MPTCSPIPARSRVASVQAVGDAQALDWLKRMGVVVVDEFGTWRLTDLGTRAMKRFDQSCSAPRAATPVADG